MYVLQGQPRGTTTVFNSITGNTTPLSILNNHHAVQGGIAEGTVLHDYTGTTRANISSYFWGNAEKDAFLAHLQVAGDNNVFLNGVSTIFQNNNGLRGLPYNSGGTNVTWTAATGTLTFADELARTAFLLAITDNAIARGTQPLISREVALNLNGNILVVGVGRVNPAGAGNQRTITPLVDRVIIPAAGGNNNTLQFSQTSAPTTAFTGAQLNTAGATGYNADITNHTLIASAEDRIVISNFRTQATTQARTQIFPADRCTWHQVQDGGSDGYSITGATYYNGVDANGLIIDEPSLGFIGKSGRFVQIAD